MRASTALICALFCVLSGCTTPATQFLVFVDTDLPVSSMMSLSTLVVGAQGHSESRLLGSRGPGDAGVQVPFSFGVTPGGSARDGTVRLTVTATIAPTGPTSPTLSVSGSARLTFVPGRSLQVGIFLSRACSAVVAGCQRTPAAQCTRSALCQETGLTCDATGACVPPPNGGPPMQDAGIDGSTDACRPQCTGRVCGDDHCGGLCGRCPANQMCQTNGQCAASCGAVGMPCCSGPGQCNDTTASCVAGMCVAAASCGAIGQACCSGSTCIGPGSVCHLGHCQSCGDTSQWCCAGSICNGGLTCDSGRCSVCGGSGQPCCAGSCDAGYCYAGTCFDSPTLTDPGPEGAGCFDFGVMHATTAWVVHGRPGATGSKHARQISCAGSVDWIPSDGCFTIGADGTYSSLVTNPPLTNCDMELLGQWSSYVVVDGQTSAESRLIFFNSSCPSTSTCYSAQTFCPTAPAVGAPMSCP